MPKNIVLFFTDQQRADTCGCHGSSLGLTPNLDALAAEGAAFDSAFTCQPVCGPARAVIQTGQHATRNGCYRNGIPLRDDGNTLAHLMGRSGYSCNYIGKWHLASTGLDPVPADKRCGYDGEWKAADLLEFTSDAYEGHLYDRNDRRLDFSGRYRADVLTDYAVDFVKDPGDKPFFLMLSYLEPHHQNTRFRYIAPDGYAERCKDLPPPPDLAALDKPDADWRANLADYYGCVRSLDENLGRIIDALKESGRYDDTVVIFASDHGNHFRTRNGEYKRTCHEASVHIPLVIRGGKYVGAGRIRNTFSLVDLAPTILEIAGAPVPECMDGRAAECLLDGGAGWDDDMLIQISESEVARALRTPRYKYCVTAPHKDGWFDAASDVYVEEYLYDLEADPYELTNIVADPACETVKKELREKLLAKIVAAGEAKPHILPLPGINKKFCDNWS